MESIVLIYVFGNWWYVLPWQMYFGLYPKVASITSNCDLNLEKEKTIQSQDDKCANSESNWTYELLTNLCSLVKSI